MMELLTPFGMTIAVAIVLGRWQLPLMAVIAVEQPARLG